MITTADYHKPHRITGVTTAVGVHVLFFAMLLWTPSHPAEAARGHSPPQPVATAVRPSPARPPAAKRHGGFFYASEIRWLDGCVAQSYPVGDTGLAQAIPVR